ncbi:MAG: hypothetical protein WCA28_12165 [Bradyrhizobium sp.]
MTSAEVIPAVVLKRKAVVYVRQSTQSQVMTNLESKRRQYDLVDVARQRGFVDVEISAGPNLNATRSNSLSTITVVPAVRSPAGVAGHSYRG